MWLYTGNKIPKKFCLIIIIILKCPASAYVRRVSGLEAYVNVYALGGGFLQSRVLRAYVGGDGVDVGALNQQAATLKQVLESWFQQVSSL